MAVQAGPASDGPTDHEPDCSDDDASGSEEDGLSGDEHDITGDGEDADGVCGERDTKESDDKRPASATADRVSSEKETAKRGEHG
ncbi:hypothetical protein GL213_09875 [Halogeometricum borinquense]|nr:hypothetical protein GL213_09875 [Halogeometricum borinquense]